MNTYTYSQARQNFSAVLDQALKDGEVRIRRKDGQVFVLKPQPASGSPLDFEGLDLGISEGEILEAIQEGRGSYRVKSES